MKGAGIPSGRTIQPQRLSNIFGLEGACGKEPRDRSPTNSRLRPKVLLAQFLPQGSTRLSRLFPGGPGMGPGNWKGVAPAKT